MREDSGPRPSARAAERLAADVGAEVAHLRGALRSALDQADQLQAAGRHDLAADVLEGQRATLAAVHQHLSDRLAAAAVEREAEHIVEAAPRPAQEPAPHVAPATPPTPAEVPATAEVGATPVGPFWDGTVVRLVASAAAAVAGLALLFSPDLGAGALSAAGWGVTEDAPQSPTSDNSASAEAAETTASDVTSAGEVATHDTTSPAARAGDDATATRAVDGPRRKAPGESPAPLGLDVLSEVLDLVPAPVADATDQRDDEDDADRPDGAAPLTTSEDEWDGPALDDSAAE